MKKTYQNPTCLYLALSAEDVIATSGNTMSSGGSTRGSDIDTDHGTSLSSFFSVTD